MKDLIEQFKDAINQMERQNRDYEELHLSKENCEYLIYLIQKENS